MFLKQTYKNNKKKIYKSKKDIKTKKNKVKVNTVKIKNIFNFFFSFLIFNFFCE